MTIEILIKDQTQAVDIVADLIDWERLLRGNNRGIPVTQKIRLANRISKARRSLQERAGLVKVI